MPRSSLAFFARLGLFDHLLEQYHVAQAVAQPGFGSFAITTSAAGFLVVASIDLGRSVCATSASGLSMPMPKAMVAHMTMPSSRREAALVVRAHFRRQASVVGQGVEALAAEESSGLLDLARDMQ